MRITCRPGKAESRKRNDDQTPLVCAGGSVDVSALYKSLGQVQGLTRVTNEKKTQTADAARDLESLATSLKKEEDLDWEFDEIKPRPLHRNSRSWSPTCENGFVAQQCPSRVIRYKVRAGESPHMAGCDSAEINRIKASPISSFPSTSSAPSAS